MLHKEARWGVWHSVSVPSRKHYGLEITLPSTSCIVLWAHLSSILLRSAQRTGVQLRAPEGGRRPTDGLRYPRVGGVRQRHFAGTDLKPRKLPENAPLPPVGCTLCWAAYTYPALFYHRIIKLDKTQLLRYQYFLNFAKIAEDLLIKLKGDAIQQQ